MRLAVSNPSMPGMLTSSRITANSSFISCSRACRPELARTSPKPRPSRMLSYDMSRAGWSSTSRILISSPGAAGAGSREGCIETSDDINARRSAMQPHAHEREQLFGIHRLRDIVGGARFEALLTVALHGLGGERDDRQHAETGIRADAPHRL